MFSSAWLRYFWDSPDMHDDARAELSARLSDLQEQLGRMEAEMVRKKDYATHGDRVVYNTLTGTSENIDGYSCDPDKLDRDGLQVRF